MKIRAYDFEVQGHYNFPIDMLRYDRCMPVDGDSAAAILNSIQEDDRIVRTVKLRQYTASGMNGPTHQRWSSFGWPVVSDSVRKVA